jgi:nucleoside-diphosphate-sugar epimerase
VQVDPLDNPETLWRYAPVPRPIKVTVLGRGPLALDCIARLDERWSASRIDIGREAGPGGIAIDIGAAGASRRLAEALQQTTPTVLVHLATTTLPEVSAEETSADERTADVLERALGRASVRLRRIVLLSSTAVYGVARSAPLVFTEHDPMAEDLPYPDSVATKWMRGLQRSERRVRELCTRTGVELTVLRAADTVGGASVSAATEMLRAAAIVRAWGWDPPFQLLHYLDLLEALSASLDTGAAGVYNIVGRGVVRLSRLASAAGAVALPLPAPLADRAVAQSLGPARLRWRCVADGRLAKQRMGFHPRFSTEEAVRGRS